MLCTQATLQAQRLLVRQWPLPNCHARRWSRLSVSHSSLTSHGRLPVNTVTIWRTALERLEQLSIDATSKTWLQEAHLANYLAATTSMLQSLDSSKRSILRCKFPMSQAYNVINTRWRRPIEEILADLTGQSVMLSVTHKSGRRYSRHSLTMNGRESSEHASFSPPPKNTYSYSDMQPSREGLPIHHPPNLTAL